MGIPLQFHFLEPKIYSRHVFCLEGRPRSKLLTKPRATLATYNFPLFYVARRSAEHNTSQAPEGRRIYTPARKDSIHISSLSELISRKTTFQLQEKFSGTNFLTITYHVFICDSENYMEKLFRNYFLGKSHVSYMK